MTRFETGDEVVFMQGGEEHAGFIVDVNPWSGVPTVEVNFVDGEPVYPRQEDVKPRYLSRMA